MAGILFWFGQVLQNGDVGSLRAFVALLDFEFDLLAFIQVAETFALDGGVVDKDIRAILTSNEAVALAAVEPLDRADDTFRHIICLLMAKEKMVCQSRSIGRSKWNDPSKETSGHRFSLSNVNLLASYNSYHKAKIRIRQGGILDKEILYKIIIIFPN